MRDYGKVFSRIWESADFRSLTEDGRTLVMYLLTCQHGTIAGAFRVPDGYATEDLQWTAERVAAGFAELLRKGFANRCETSKWVWVMKFLEWNPPENPNQRKAAVKVACSVPDSCAWKREFMRVCGPSLGIEPPPCDIPPENPSETLGEGLLNQKQEQKQEQDQKQEHSGTDVPGGKPPKLTDPKEIIFGFGLTLLVNASVPEKQARSFLGGRVKEYEEGPVIDALRDCAKAKPLQPLEWLAAALPPKGARGSKHAGFSGKNYREGVSDDGSFH
jgi:hypothetical protein